VEVLLWIVALALIVVGLVGVLLPALPGPALVLGGIAIVAGIDGFERIGYWTLAWSAVLTVLAIGVDYAAQALGARQFGGSGWGILGAVCGLVVGLFFAPLGILLGPAFGAALLELIFARKTTEEALRAGFGTFIGFVLGTVVRYAIVFTMLGLAVVAYMV